MIIVITAVFALLLAFILGIALGFFREFFDVPQDPLVDRIREALPGANCGACGYPGCDAYAAAVSSGKAGVTGCSVGGQAAADKLSAIMGVSGTIVPTVAVLACRGSKEHTFFKGDYTGVPACRAAKISAGGTKLCAWGCLGFGDCVKVCKFGALSMGDNGLPRIDYSKCTGCKRCTLECPQQIIRNIPRDLKGSIVLCSNRNPIKAMVLKTCKVGCIKCGVCERGCPEKCITLQNNLPAVDYSKCTACGACAAKCPTKVLKLISV